MDFIVQEDKKDLDEYIAKRQKRGRNEEEAPGEEKTILHGTVAIAIWDIWMLLLYPLPPMISPKKMFL